MLAAFYPNRDDGGLWSSTCRVDSTPSVSSQSDVGIRRRIRTCRSAICKNHWLSREVSDQSSPQDTIDSNSRHPINLHNRFFLPNGASMQARINSDHLTKGTSRNVHVGRIVTKLGCLDDTVSRWTYTSLVTNNSGTMLGLYCMM